MMSFSLNEIETIKDNVSVEDLLDYFGINYKTRGEELNFICPFHEDKNPSCFLNTDSLTFHCFGCKSSGDVITFVKNLMEFTFSETLEFLKDFSLQPNEILNQVKMYRKQKSNTLKLDTVFPINETLYPDYLKHRNILLETARHFELGICLTGDFKNRIIIPVRTKKETLYLGRSLYDSIDGIKYLKLGDFNSVLYNDSEDKKEVIIVEGTFDVYQLYQAGFPNSISTFGNNVTPIQKSILFRKEKILCVPDNDTGGEILIETLKEFPNFYIGRLPKEYKDAGECPNEILKNLEFKRYNKSISIEKIGVIRK